VDVSGLPLSSKTANDQSGEAICVNAKVIKNVDKEASMVVLLGNKDFVKYMAKKQSEVDYLSNLFTKLFGGDDKNLSVEGRLQKFSTNPEDLREAIKTELAQAEAEEDKTIYTAKNIALMLCTIKGKEAPKAPVVPVVTEAPVVTSVETPGPEPGASGEAPQLSLDETATKLLDYLEGHKGKTDKDELLKAMNSKHSNVRRDIF
jgi:uncharacterized membrane protein